MARPTAGDRSFLPLAAGSVLGFGLGMFVDGIVLHQVLQWHHLVSEFEPTTTVPGLETNTFWDGVFHAGAWVVTVAGTLLLWLSHARRRRLPGRALAGLLLAGWGAFNVVDQFVFHLALEAHHIRDVEDPAVYDWSFFALGVVLVAVGVWLVGSARGRPTAGRGA